MRGGSAERQTVKATVHQPELRPVGDRSGDDVGQVGIDHQLDMVLEVELALLEPGDLELVADRLRAQRPDPLIEQAVLGLQGGELGRVRLIVVHCALLYSILPLAGTALAARRAARRHGQTVQ
jgi:hypothetical protein